MSKEVMKDGRIIEGGPTDVKGRATLNRDEVKELKEQMYADFIAAKRENKVGLEKTFDSWLRDSVEMLRNARRTELSMDLNSGRLSQAEFDALNTMRESTISAIISMDCRELDQYGIQYVNPTSSSVSGAVVGDAGGLLLPDYRKDKVKFNKDVKN